jgi:hypothetical protein
MTEERPPTTQESRPPLAGRPPSPPAAAARPTRRERARRGIVGTFGWLGIFGIGAAAGAIMGWQDVDGWIIGVVVSGVTVLLGLLLRRSLARTG